MKIFFYLLPVFIGVAMTVQSGINGQLRTALGYPLLAAFLSFLGGIVLLGVLLLFSQQSMPAWSVYGDISWYKYIGGFLGAFVVYAVIISVYKVGASNMFVLIVAGQLITALWLDHYGLLGLKESPITTQKMLGILLVVAGAYLVNKK
jgi:transporter family-2 protein